MFNPLILWHFFIIFNLPQKLEVYITNIATTVDSMLHIQMPGGSVGHFIEEVSPL
jgi:hypothetical protein